MGEKNIRTFLSDARDKTRSEQGLVQRAIDMARLLGAPAIGKLNGDERACLAALSRLVDDEPSRRFAEQLCELALRDNARAAERLRQLLAEMGGIPTFFSSMARLRLKAASMASRGMQGAALGEMKRVFRSTFEELVLTAHPTRVNRRAEAMAKEGVQLMLCPMQPEVFGESAAEKYAAELEKTLAEYPRAGVVVQALRLCPGLHPASPDHGAAMLAERLRRCLSAARSGGSPRPVILETHGSDTLPIIVEALKQTLDSPKYDTADIALELPAYLRTSPAVVRELADWAKPRSQRGATPLKVLIVKGSHLVDERRLAARYGTTPQLCSNKTETDVAFARLLNAAMSCPAKVITPIIGTHELTHLCYAVLRWARSGREGLPPLCFVCGLGNHLARLFAKQGSPVLLRAPLAPAEGESGVFERYLLDLMSEISRPGGFLAGGYAADASGNTLSDKARPLMTASSPRDDEGGSDATPAHGFVPGHLGALLERPYVDAFYAAARAESERPQDPIPLVLGGEVCESPLTFIHRSLTVPKLVDYRFSCADYQAVETALQWAEKAAVARKPGEDDRVASLLKAARELRHRSEEFAALLVRDGGFTLTDAQTELRDSVDALRFYADDALRGGFADGTIPQPLGVVVVSAGTAHPLADALSGIAAAWVAGNTIIYKPAAYSTLLGTRLSALLQEAGVEHLCFPSLDNEIATLLFTDSRVQALICSADPATARNLWSCSPQSASLLSPAAGPCVYLGETCDWRAALRDITTAAFRRSGSSPSCPLCVLAHNSLYDDPAFIAALQDAVSSLTTKPTWLSDADLGPVPSPLGEKERRLLTEPLVGGAAWRVTPRAEEPGSLLWQPGLCVGLDTTSPVLRDGRRLPLLRLMRAESAEQAYALGQNINASSAFVLYSRNSEEIEDVQRDFACRWLAVNCLPAPRPGAVPQPLARTTLGAAVAPLAGGSNYAPALCRWEERTRPSCRSTRRHLTFDPKGIVPATSGAEETMRLSAAADSVSYWWEREFSTPHDLPTADGLRATLSYHPIRVCLRIEKAMSDADIAIALMAALQTGCRLSLSLDASRPWLLGVAEQYGLSMSVQKRGEYEASFPALAAGGFIVRDPAALDDTLAAATAASLPLINASVLANGRLELLYYLEERLTIRPRD